MEKNIPETELARDAFKPCCGKSALRKKMRALRDSLPAPYRRRVADHCKNLLLNSALFKKSEWVYCYVSVRSELDTRELIREMLRYGKHVAVPKTVNGTLDFREIRSVDECEPGMLGIPEPVCGKYPWTMEPAKEPGLMLMPGLAFDREGNRLGYGAGCYDRYLAAHPGNITAALAFPEQIIDTVPADALDVKVEHLITMDKIISLR